MAPNVIQLDGRHIAGTLEVAEQIVTLLPKLLSINSRIKSWHFINFIDCLLDPRERVAASAPAMCVKEDTSKFP